MRPQKYETAKGIFKDTNLDTNNEGKRYLGAVIGKEEFRKEYDIMRVNEWVAELKLLSKIASIHKQHIAHSHRLLHKNSTISFKLYPTSALCYNPLKMSFDRSL